MTQQTPNTIQWDPVAVREFFLQAPESGTARIVAVVVSLGLLITILLLVRKRVLREEYTPIWLMVAAGMMLISLRMDFLQTLTRWIGAWSPSSTILFFGEVFLVLISLNYAVRLSRYGLQLKNLVQENALLRERLDSLESSQACEDDHPSQRD